MTCCFTVLPRPSCSQLPFQPALLLLLLLPRSCIRVNKAKPAQGRGKAIWADADEWFENLKQGEDGVGEEVGGGDTARGVGVAKR